MAEMAATIVNININSNNNNTIGEKQLQYYNKVGSLGKAFQNEYDSAAAYEKHDVAISSNAAPATLMGLCTRSMAYAILQNTYQFKELQTNNSRVFIQDIWNVIEKCERTKWTKVHINRILASLNPSELYEMDLSQMALHDEVVQTLINEGYVATLRNLGVRITPENQTLTRDVFVSLLNNLARVKKLKVIFSGRIKDDPLTVGIDLGELVPHLKKLEFYLLERYVPESLMSSSKLVNGDVWISRFFDSVFTLQLFYFDHPSIHIAPSTLKRILTQNVHLKHLILDNCSEDITDSVLVSITRHCNQLETISLRGNRRISDAGFVNIGRGFVPSLQHLSLNSCRKLTDTTLYHIAEGCPLLSFLDIRYCQNLCQEIPLNDLLNGLVNLADLLLCYNTVRCELSDEFMTVNANRLVVHRRYWNEASKKMCTHYFRLSQVNIKNPNDMQKEYTTPPVLSSFMQSIPARYWKANSKPL